MITAAAGRCPPGYGGQRQRQREIEGGSPGGLKVFNEPGLVAKKRFLKCGYSPNWQLIKMQKLLPYAYYGFFTPPPHLRALPFHTFVARFYSAVFH